MNAQFYSGQAGAVPMVWGEPLRIDSLGGEFVVLEGRVWLTRRGDTQDHVLGAGQRMVLEPADAVVIEPWHRDQPAVVRWKPCVRADAHPRSVVGLLRGFAALALRAVAFAAGRVALGLRAEEAGLAALARKAASMARRAQGCISAGDSIASAGTVQ